jgi:transcription antitermination factor NusG
MSYWAIVQTQSRKEDAVEGRLIRAGYKTYLPKIIIRKEIGVYLPGYMFVRIVHGSYDVRWTEGVIALLKTSNQSALENYMAETHRKERKGYIPATLPKPQRGQKVRIIRGSFLGHSAVVDGLSGRERVWVLLDIVGGKVPVELPSRDIELLPLVGR